MLEVRLSDLLELVAGESAVAGGGAAAAAAVAMAAAAVAMAARRSRGVWAEAGAAAAQAEVLRERAGRLVQEDADAYRHAHERLRGTESDERPEQRDWQLGQALRRAADVPLAVAETAADVADLGTEVAAECEPAIRPEAVAGCMLAEAGVRIGVQLIEVNLATTPDDERLVRARAALGRAERSRAAVVEAG
jgi:formiminotetrahydrofolate cyclodeaminase